MNFKRKIGVIALVLMLLPFASIKSAAEETGESPNTGSVTVESAGEKFPSLSEALSNAAESDTLFVSGGVEVPASFAIGKNITLKAADEGGRLFTNSASEAAVITVDGGKAFTLGTGTAELLMEGIHIKVTDGKFFLKDGAHIVSNLSPLSIIEISGGNTTAVFEGGIVENKNTDKTKFNNWYLVSVFDGATVESISGGTFSGGYIAFNVYGEGTMIKSITGGKFSNFKDSGQSEPCFKLYRKAHIDKISGGEFLSYRFGALQLESGASVGEISGGYFKNPLESSAPESSGAMPYFSGLVLYGRTVGSPLVNEPVTVGKISGGTFEGQNGILAVGNFPDQSAKIGEITGGTFTGKVSAGLYFTQNSQVDLISGSPKVTGRGSGIWNAGRITKISGGTYNGETGNGVINVDMSSSGPPYKYFKGEIGEISGGVFEGSKNGIRNVGKMGSITGGAFKGGKCAVLCEGEDGLGALDKISGGAFYAENGDCRISLVSRLNLEPELSNNQPEFGTGRYIAPQGKPIFNDESLVVFPNYTDSENPGSALKYFISSPDDLKQDSEVYSDIGFRFLRKKITVKYNYNFGSNPTEKTDKYLNPGDSVVLWADSGNFAGDPENCEFGGWNTKADGTGTKYSGGDTIENVTKDIVLYAVWNEKTTDNPDPGTDNPGGNNNTGETPTPPTDTNSKPDANVPNTGDGNTLFGFFIIAAVSGIGIAIFAKNRTSNKI
jgi:hypothetical protein